MWHYYDETERRTWQNPEEILTAIGLKIGQTFIDVGCGEGFFTLPAARIVGQNGHVFAIDSNPQSMARLEKKAAGAGLTNISLAVQEAESSLICDACADFIFFGIVLHDFREPDKVLLNARQMLKLGGHLINLDWKKEPMKLGPPLEKRFDVSTASAMLRKAGFALEKSENWGDYNYLMTAKVKA